jgi:hypothetical protein
MNAKRTLTTLVAAAVLLAGLPAGAVAATGDLAIDVTEHEDGSATVTVTDNGSAAANATVAVDANATNDSYAGEGTYEADGNGTVSLPAPDNGSNVTVEITATLGNDSATTTATLGGATDATNESETEVATDGAFGQHVQAFVQQLLAEGTTGIGQAVSTFVTANNPGADHRSENADAALNGDRGPDAAGDAAENGKPDDAGKPAHAGGPDDAGAQDQDDGNETDTDDESETEDDGDDEEEDDEEEDDGGNNGKAKGKR